ncbi:TPA: hypothetical protein ACH3X2_004883 [Trebouxia sp. C0005]
MHNASEEPPAEQQPRKKAVVEEERQELCVRMISAEPLPVRPEEWQSDVSAATKATLQEAIKHAQELALGNMPYNLDTRPVSEQCSDPAVPKRDKDMMYYLQKHGENLEADPPIYGCLHPKWQKQHKDKLLSKEEWSALWQIEQCSMDPINPKSSHHMTSLDKWTVSALCQSTYSIFWQSGQ